MGNPKRSGKQSSNSRTSRSRASAGLVIKKKVPVDTEDFTELTNDVNRETLAENIGAPEGDVPNTAAVPRADGDHSDSDISSNVH